MRLSIIIILFTFYACSEEAFYSSKTTFNEGGWTYADTLSFDLTISDTSSIYSMDLMIGHLKEYSYENIYLNVTTDFPTLNSRNELLNIQVADKKGMWLGDCSSKSCLLDVVMLDNFKFPEPGNYSFKFEQSTRTDSLQGIQSVGLIINKRNYE